MRDNHDNFELQCKRDSNGKITCTEKDDNSKKTKWLSSIMKIFGKISSIVATVEGIKFLLSQI